MLYKYPSNSPSAIFLDLPVMAHFDQKQAPVAYPPPGHVYPPPQQPMDGYAYAQGPYVAAPPPVGYPTKDDSGYSRYNQPVETRSKGDDFLKGCFAALCCCCVLDFCFC